MNGTNGKQSDFPDVALVPYPVIVAATKGDPDAMKIVLQHFSGYILHSRNTKLCRRYNAKSLIEPALFFCHFSY